MYDLFFKTLYSTSSISKFIFPYVDIQLSQHHSLNCLGSFVSHQLTVEIRVYFGAFISVSLAYMSVLLPVPHVFVTVDFIIFYNTNSILLLRICPIFIKNWNNRKSKSKNHHLSSHYFGGHLSSFSEHTWMLYECIRLLKVTHKDTSVFAHAHCSCVLFEWIRLLSTLRENWLFAFFRHFCNPVNFYWHKLVRGAKFFG